MFAKIKHINDVLPHIEGYDEFVVLEKENYTVIDYNFMDSHTFSDFRSSEKGLDSTSIRRECRGLIFDSNGVLISRAFHKFFNVGEREETLVDSIDWSRPHTVTVKRDGSMIRPLSTVDGGFRLATRKGITDVAKMAENYMMANPEYRYRELCESTIASDLVCIFEFHSVDNMVVIDYGNPFMELLAIRHLHTGEYLSYDKVCAFALTCNVPVVPQVEVDLTKPNSFLDSVKGEVDSEGYVIRFHDGQIVKVKNDWYVQLHHVVSGLNQERNMVRLALNNEIDDILAVLPDNRRIQVQEFVDIFWDRYKLFKTLCFNAWDSVDADVMADLDESRKAYALRIQKEDKFMQPILFKFLDVDDNVQREEFLKQFVLNKTNKTKLFDDFIDWLME